MNVEITNDAMAEFCQMYNLKNIIKEPTCYKNPNNPSSIDVILTNREGSFSNSIANETCLSGHHKMILSVLNTYIKKREHTVIHYRIYKNFKERLFRNDLIKQLQNNNKTVICYYDFRDNFITVLERYAL